MTHCSFDTRRPHSPTFHLIRQRTLVQSLSKRMGGSSRIAQILKFYVGPSFINLMRFLILFVWLTLYEVFITLEFVLYVWKYNYKAVWLTLITSCHNISNYQCCVCNKAYTKCHLGRVPGSNSTNIRNKWIKKRDTIYNSQYLQFIQAVAAIIIFTKINNERLNFIIQCMI